MPSFKVYVSKDYTVFCAGHFITYEGDKCEPLHGHNYRVAAVLEGELTQDAYVFNFVTLKHLLRRVCDSLDHRLLLPRDNPLLTLTKEETSLTVRYREKTYLFPRGDVVVLPISNTTAEKLAAWISDQLVLAMNEQDRRNLTALEIEVEESFGQSAFCRRSFEAE
ncbi:MAG: 6-pyruvoyl trahydropterin synthase family protein [Aggregatilineales bacterium]